MPAQLYCTGPALIAVKLPTLGGLPVFLGTCENHPSIFIKRENRPIRNDLGADAPFDLQYTGIHALISLPLNRYDEAVYAAISAMPHGNPALRGTELEGDPGTLYSLEGKAAELLILFPYAAGNPIGKAAQGAMPRGYRFLAAAPVDPETLDPLGTVARRITLQWQAWRKPNGRYGGGFLYTHDLADFPEPT